MSKLSIYTDTLRWIFFVRIVAFVFSQILGYSLPFGLSLLIGIVVVYLIQQKRINLIHYLGYLVVVGGGLGIASRGYYYIVDIGRDSNTYHLEILVKYLSGHLFFYDYQVINEYVTYFPKNIHVLYGHLAYLFGLGQGTMIKLVLIIVSFVTYRRVLATSGKQKSPFYITIGLLLVLNPVVLYQSYSYYLDDIGYLLLLNIVFHLLLRDYTILGVIASIYVGSKMSYGIFLVIGIVGMLSYLWHQNMLSKERNNLITYIQQSHTKTLTMRILGICFLLMCMMVALHQYVFNMIRSGNPFYPIYGEGKDIITEYIPRDIRSYSTPVQLLVGYSSYSKDSCYEKSDCPTLISLTNRTSIKKVFTSYRSAFFGPDPIINGFGTLFTFIMFFSIILLVYNILYAFQKKHILYMYLIVGVLIASFSLGSIWARFIPFLYTIPVIVMLYSMSTSRRDGFLNYCVGIIIGLSVMNIIGIIGAMGSYVPGMYKYRRDVDAYMSDANQTGRLLYHRTVYDSFNIYRVIDRYSLGLGRKTQEISQEELVSLCGMNSLKQINDYSHNLITVCPTGKTVVRVLYGLNTNTYFIRE